MRAVVPPVHQPTRHVSPILGLQYNVKSKPKGWRGNLYGLLGLSRGRTWWRFLSAGKFRTARWARTCAYCLLEYRERLQVDRKQAQELKLGY